MNWPSQSRRKDPNEKQQQGGIKKQTQMLLAAQLARHSNDNEVSFMKKTIQHNRSQLIQLMESQLYCQEAMQLNRTAVEKMRNGQIQEATIRLAEAEKILEYAANSGRDISRNLIITVLHNEACCHQLSWQLQRCSNYIQALIYNINCKIRSIETEGQDSSKREELEIEQISMKRSLSQYYLVYCAINSQLKQNEAALSAAKKANYLLRTTSSALSRSRLSISAQKDISRILNQLGRLKQRIQDLQINTLLQMAKHYLRLWKNKCSFPNFQLRSISNALKQYSIGNLLQMEPMVSQYQSKPQKWIGLSHEIVFESVMILSMSYFTIATELRLLAIELGGGKLQAKLLKQYRESQCYHLVAIILVTYYIPFDIIYLEHILTSFSNHYKIELGCKSSLSANFKEAQLFQLLLQSSGNNFEVKGSTTGNSQKQQSPATSHFSLETDKHQTKLQSDVRQSLKGQNLQDNRQFAKLNNYYYVRPYIKKGKQKKKKDKEPVHSNPSKSANLRKACLTSKQSAQRTPVGFSPAQLSPRHKARSPKSQRAELPSNRCSIGKVTKEHRPQKVSNVMEEYFSKDRLSKNKYLNKQLMKNNKRQKERQDKQSLSSKKMKQVNFKVKGTEKLHFRSTQGENEINSKDNKQIRYLKSPIKMKEKFTEVKGKKKTTVDSYY